MSTRFDRPGRVTPATSRAAPPTGSDLLVWTYQTTVFTFGSGATVTPLSPKGNFMVPFFRIEADTKNSGNGITFGLQNLNSPGAAALGGGNGYITVIGPGEWVQIEDDSPWDSMLGHFHAPGDLFDVEPYGIELDHAIQMVDLSQFYLLGFPAAGFTDVAYLTIGQRTRAHQ